MPGRQAGLIVPSVLRALAHIRHSKFQHGIASSCALVRAGLRAANHCSGGHGARCEAERHHHHPRRHRPKVWAAASRCTVFAARCTLKIG
jgi:hypothetical protein